MAKTSRPRSFVHLHLHSMYSLLDGGNRLDKLVARVKELGMEAVAVTDHGNLFGAVEFYTKAKAEGIKPILGIEAYIAPDLGGKPSDRLSREYTGVSDGGFHLVLLAENNLGWSNLLKLSSDSFIKGFYYKPRMDKTTLTQWHDGLIAINGHLGSSIAHYLVQYEQTKNEAHFEAARKEAIWHRDLFGKNEKGEPRFYLELQSHAEKLQDQINPHIVQLARELDIPLVCDNDAHFLTADDWDAHDTLCCISMGKVKTEENRLRYPRDLYVKSPEEMSKRFVQELDLPEAIDNTRRIAERCNVELDFGANHAPVVKIETDLPKLPADSKEALKVIDRFSKHCEHPVGSTAWYKAFCATIRVQPFNSEEDDDSPDDLKEQCDGALRLLTEAGAIWRYGSDGVDDAKRARMERELTVLRDKLISAYFMIVWDFVNEARRRDIPVNARGSGVGTMTGYCLGLSNACPVEYGLLFERFTDPDRSEYPDIDIDMCQDGRGDLIAYVREKYGHVAQIITFGTLKARAAIRDVGRVLDMPLPEVDKVCKLIGDGLGTTLEKAQQQEPDLRKLLDDSPTHRAMYDTAKRLEGLARHAGVHAAGVIVATQPLDNIVPLYQPPGTEQIVTQWDGPTCEKVGLLKMDFLGLRTLSIIERAKLLIRQTLDEQTIRDTVSPDVRSAMSDVRADQTSNIANDPLDLDRLAYDDPRVFELFARGETAGVFQFESGGMRNLLMAMKPDRLEDLIAANALYRPGPMELIPNYNNRKHGREQVPQMHEIVDRLTAETHGIMVYQEQVMQVLNELGGIPLREAYTIIKAISKKKEKTINAARADFVKGADTQGVNAKQANELFDLILKFAGYGFNKSHSTGYAIIAYQTAYLKTYFPVQYMAALLTYESVSTDKVVEYMDECAHVLRPSIDGKAPQRGIEVKPPDINQSDVGFTVVYRDDEPRDAAHGHIRFGLSAVKGVGEKAILAIRSEREANGPYKGLYDFCERVDLRAVNRSTTEALIKCGAFDTVHGIAARAALCEALETAIKVGQRAAADKASGQMSIFGGAAPAADASPRRGESRDSEPALPSVIPWSKKQLLDHEKEVLGLYASSHPLHDHKAELDRYSTITIPQIKEQGLPAGVKVIVGGMLSRVRPTIVKRGRSQGQKMAHLTLEDSASNKIDATVFSDVFASNYLHLEQDRVVFLEGKIDRGREEPGLLVDRVIPIEQAVERLTRTLRIVIHDHGEPGRHNGASKEQFGRLRELLRQSAMRSHGNGNGSANGNAEVVLELHQAGKVVALKLNGSRVPVDPDLVASIQTVMGNLDDRTARCQLLGPPKLSTDDIAQAAQYQAPRRELAFSMQDDGGESIDRY